MSFDTTVDFERDGWGRPRVVEREGSKLVAYTRCTTFVDALDEKYRLSLWQQRMVAVGLSLRPDLLLGISALAPELTLPSDEVPNDAKKKGDELCSKAIEAAQGSAAATTGTALHLMTQTVDRGGSLGIVPASAALDIEAYRKTTSVLRALHIEQPMVHDGFLIGGTPDRIVDFDGRTYIADLKTGSIDFGAMKIAMQLATYAHSTLYDVTQRKRLKTPEIDKRRAIVIHLPAGKATCELLWVDIQRGWRAVHTADQVRRWRKETGWFTPVSVDASLFDVTPDNVTGASEAAQELSHRLAELITRATTVEALTGLWAMNIDAWDDGLTELAQQRKAQITGAVA